LLPILKIKRSTYHIFTPNKRKIQIRHGYWIQSTLYECSLKVLYNLGFQSSITKRNKARVMPLVYAMSTSTKNRHAYLLLDQMKPVKRLQNYLSSQHILTIRVHNKHPQNYKDIKQNIPSHYSSIHMPSTFLSSTAEQL